MSRSYAKAILSTSQPRLCVASRAIAVSKLEYGLRAILLFGFVTALIVIRHSLWGRSCAC